MHVLRVSQNTPDPIPSALTAAVARAFQHAWMHLPTEQLAASLADRWTELKRVVAQTAQGEQTKEPWRSWQEHKHRAIKGFASEILGQEVMLTALQHDWHLRRHASALMDKPGSSLPMGDGHWMFTRPYNVEFYRKKDESPGTRCLGEVDMIIDNGDAANSIVLLDFGQHGWLYKKISIDHRRFPSIQTMVQQEMEMTIEKLHVLLHCRGTQVSNVQQLYRGRTPIHCCYFTEVRESPNTHLVLEAARETLLAGQSVQCFRKRLIEACRNDRESVQY